MNTLFTSKYQSTWVVVIGKEATIQYIKVYDMQEERVMPLYIDAK